jgi:hypothetical protein
MRDSEPVEDSFVREGFVLEGPWYLAFSVLSRK